MDAEPWSSSHRFLTRIAETVAEYRSRDIHLHTHPIVLRSCGAGRRCRWTHFLSIGTPWMPHNALEWHVCVQMNVTRIWFCRTRLCLSDYASFGPASSCITHLPHLAFHQASLFHRLLGNWFCTVLI